MSKFAVSKDVLAAAMMAHYPWPEGTEIKADVAPWERYEVTFDITSPEIADRAEDAVVTPVFERNGDEVKFLKWDMG